MANRARRLKTIGYLGPPAGGRRHCSLRFDYEYEVGGKISTGRKVAAGGPGRDNRRPCSSASILATDAASQLTSATLSDASTGRCGSLLRLTVTTTRAIVCSRSKMPPSRTFNALTSN